MSAVEIERGLRPGSPRGAPPVATPARPVWSGRPEVDGKLLRVGSHRFPVRGVTYGTFAETESGSFPPPQQIRRDFGAMAAAGVNTVRTYTVPGPGTLDLAADAGLRVLVGIWWDDPRTLGSPTRATWSETATGARAAVRQAAARLGDHPALLGFLVGNEIPAPIVRWYGRRRVERLLRELYEMGKAAAPEALFGYANYPTTEYLDTSPFELECFNVFLESEGAFRRYLAQLQVASAERPLVLTEIGLDSAAHGERSQAEVLDWQLRAGAEYGLAGACVFAWTDEWWVRGSRVEDWSFGLTRSDREGKPALDVLSEHYRRRSPLELRERWPSVSVVVCAYQAEETIEECVESLLALDYPDYEIVVIDDGSTDRTAELARRFPVRVVAGGRRGLSGARNLGLDLADGEIVAYVDADARADGDWLAYLALGLEAPDAAGVGGPNLSPREDPPTAKCVAAAPGGPIHVLLDDERAEHVPGCNMAFWRDTLFAIGGFDPIYRAAGDDVDVCWKLQEAGYTIRFHPAALVWHHARRRVRDFWRQQLAYGRAEALLALRHPKRFNDLGEAIWRGVVYGPASVLVRRERLYAGHFGEAPFQPLYQRPGGVRMLPLLSLVLALSVLAFLDRHLAALPFAAALALVGALLLHGVRVARRHGLRPVWRAGTLIALLTLVQPVARQLGRLRSRELAAASERRPRNDLPPPRRVERGVVAAAGVEPEERPLALEEVRGRLRAGGVRSVATPVWGEDDLVCDSALFARVRLRSYVQWSTLYLRLERTFRRPRVAAVSAVVVAFVAVWSLTLALEAVLALAALLLLEGRLLEWRVRRALGR